MKITSRYLAVLANLVLAASVAQAQAYLSAGFNVDDLKAARRTEGFEARMNVSVSRPDGLGIAKFKISVIGQISENQERLLIRGISPDSVRQKAYALEKDSHGQVRAVSYVVGAENSVEEVDPYKSLFDSSVVMWDMLAPWWNWGHPLQGSTKALDGHKCTVFGFHANSKIEQVAEVKTCIDNVSKGEIQSELYAPNHVLLRTTSVQATIRNASGHLVPKKLLISAADGTATTIEVYGGDDHYVIAPSTFSALTAKLTPGSSSGR